LQPTVSTAENAKRVSRKPPIKIIPYGFPPVLKNREYIGFDKKKGKSTVVCRC
jgi:hypothetical protein